MLGLPIKMSEAAFFKGGGRLAPPVLSHLDNVIKHAKKTRFSS